MGTMAGGSAGTPVSQRGQLCVLRVGLLGMVAFKKAQTAVAVLTRCRHSPKLGNESSMCEACLF